MALELGCGSEGQVCRALGLSHSDSLLQACLASIDDHHATCWHVAIVIARRVSQPLGTHVYRVWLVALSRGARSLGQVLSLARR